MATQSFYEDMVIDTQEAADNLNALFESGVKWKRGNGKLKLIPADDPVIVALVNKYNPEAESDDS